MRLNGVIGSAFVMFTLAGGALAQPVADAPATPTNRLVENRITLDRIDQFTVTKRGRIITDTSGAHTPHAANSDRPTDYAPRVDCPQLSTYTDASFTGGSYILQAGFVDNETAAVSYTLPPGSFPFIFRNAEMIFATQNATVQTVTQWALTIWEGTPTAGNIVAEVVADDTLIPYIRVGPGTAGTNVRLEVDPGDPEQIIVNNNGSNTFTVGYTIIRHNQPSTFPCFIPPASNRNAFPVVDTSGLSSTSGNWLEGINCGVGGCPPNGGFARFSSLSSGCRPSGDWVTRATWDPIECPGTPGACCTVTGGCVVTDRNTCTVFGGMFMGGGTTCADLNSNGKADICEAPPCPCAADFDRSGGTPDSTDIDAFFTAWLAGAGNADSDCSGGTPDSSDINVFFGQWLAGGC
jgi:hypothetical protein